MSKYIMRLFGDFTKKSPPKIQIRDTNNNDVTEIVSLKLDSFKAKISPFLIFEYFGNAELYPIFIDKVLGRFYKYKIEKLNE